MQQDCRAKERRGARARPSNGGSLAWSCRCWLVVRAVCPCVRLSCVLCVFLTSHLLDGGDASLGDLQRGQSHLASRRQRSERGGHGERERERARAGDDEGAAAEQEQRSLGASSQHTAAAAEERRGAK